jgi:hypothetical protein
MKIMFWILAVTALLSAPAAAQQQTSICVPSAGFSCPAVSATNPFPVTAGSGGLGGVTIAPTGAAASAIAPTVTAAVATGLVLKAAAGNLYAVSATAGAVAGYLLVHNTAAVPAAGAVTPVGCYVLPANSTVAVNFAPGPPLRLGTGISVSFSSTGCFTQTDSATAFISGTVQ